MRRLATAKGIIAILLWSITIALVRRISEQLGSITGAACVYAVGSIWGIISVLRSSDKLHKIIRLPRVYLLVCGLLFVNYTVIFFVAIGIADNRNQVLEVGLLNYLWPVFTLLFSVAILGYKAKWLFLPGTFLSLTGVFLVLTSNTSVTWHSLANNLAKNPTAYVLGLTAALAWALYSNLTRKWVGDMGSSAVVAFLPLTAVALSLMCLLVDEPRQWSVFVFVEVVILGTITFFAYSLWDDSMRTGNFVFVAASSYIIPFLSTIVSCVYLSVTPTPQLWVGCAILIGGSMLSWISIEQTNSVESAQQVKIPDA